MYQFGNFSRAEIGPPRLPGLVDGFEGVVRVDKTYENDTRFGSKFFCEMTVMTSNKQENPPGQLVVWKQDLTKKDVADNAIFQWAAGVQGVRREDEAMVAQLRQYMQQMMQYAIYYQDQNQFTGRYVCAKARSMTTKNGRPFTAVDFYPYVQTNGS